MVNERDTTRIGTYSLRIMGPAFHTYRQEGDNDYDAGKRFDAANQELINSIGSALNRAEDAVNDALPDGFYCKVEV